MKFLNFIYEHLHLLLFLLCSIQAIVYWSISVVEKRKESEEHPRFLNYIEWFGLHIVGSLVVVLDAYISAFKTVSSDYFGRLLITFFSVSFIVSLLELLFYFIRKLKVRILLKDS